MNKQNSQTKTIIAALILGVAVGGAAIWFFQSRKATRQASLDAAYRDFFPEALPNITNRYHQEDVEP